MFEPRRIKLRIELLNEGIDVLPVYREKYDKTIFRIDANFSNFSTMYITLHALHKTGKGQREERTVAQVVQTKYGGLKRFFSETFILSPCPLKSNKSKDILIFTVDATFDGGYKETYMSQYFYLFSKGAKCIPCPNPSFKQSCIFHNELAKEYMIRQHPWWKAPRMTTYREGRMISTEPISYHFPVYQVHQFNHVSPPLENISNQLNVSKFLMEKEFNKSGIQKTRKMKKKIQPIIHRDKRISQTIAYQTNSSQCGNQYLEIPIHEYQQSDKVNGEGVNSCERNECCGKLELNNGINQNAYQTLVEDYVYPDDFNVINDGIFLLNCNHESQPEGEIPQKIQSKGQADGTDGIEDVSDFDFWIDINELTYCNLSDRHLSFLDGIIHNQDLDCDLSQVIGE